MSSLTISAIAFTCVFGGALVGMVLRATLPKEQLSSESRDVVKLAMGTVATMSAIILGLLVSSAKAYYDTVNRELTEMSAKIVLLDRVLAHYGPESKGARDLLRASTENFLETAWSKDSSQPIRPSPSGAGEAIYDKIQDLSPKDDTQRSLLARSLNIAIDLGQTRLLMIEQSTATISVPLLLVVVFSLSITFASFSLHASPNPTVIASLILCGFAVAATLFMIMEMYSPFQGLIQIPKDPLRSALKQLGR
jgi:hypothetical protein